MNTFGFPPLVAFCVLLIVGCLSPKPTITKVHEGTPPAVRQGAKYGTFWEATQNVDLNISETLAPDVDHQHFVDALRSLVEGEVVDAERAFEELYTFSTDSLIRKYSKEILLDVLFFQSQWASFLSFSSSVSETADSKTILAQAFSRAPREIYLFPPQPTQVPTSLSLSGVPVIDVEVNGTKKRFWLDTGAGLSVIASDVAEECNVLPIGVEKAKARTSTTRKIGIQPAIVDELKIGGMSIRNHPVVIIESKNLEFKLFGLIRIIGIDGIIGWNAIKNMEVQIDYRNKLTTIAQPRKRDKDDVKRNLFWLHVPIVSLASTDRSPVNFFLDTGANRTSITDNISRKLRIIDTRTKWTTVAGAGGFERVKTKVVSDVTLTLNGQGLHFEEIEMFSREDVAFIRIDGILGSDIAKGGSIKIDYLNGRFELTVD